MCWHVLVENLGLIFHNASILNRRVIYACIITKLRRYHND